MRGGRHSVDLAVSLRSDLLGHSTPLMPGPPDMVRQAVLPQHDPMRGVIALFTAPVTVGAKSNIKG